jgi:deoxyadenosine/deoxycytidine kinase
MPFNTMPVNYIAVEGVIGAGKTSLATMLAGSLNAKLVLESFEDNPFLENFYSDPRAFALRTQLFFLLERYTQLQVLSQEELFHTHIVSDYLFEKDKIFAYLNLNDEELKIYESVVTALERKIMVPDLVIFLQSPVTRLMKNIRERARPVEKELTERYVEELHEAYNYFFSRYRSSRLMIVNCEDIDFVNNKEDFNDLVNVILKPDRAAIEYYNPALRKTAI